MLMKLFVSLKIAGHRLIHPGYGLLSENADFAKKCMEEGLVFIGPSPDIIARWEVKSKHVRR